MTLAVGGTLNTKHNNSSPTALGLGISAPRHPPQISEFCFGLGGDIKVFHPPRPDYRRFKIPSFTSPGHTPSPVCVPMAWPPFLSAELWVIRYHLGIFPNCSLPYILAISYNAQKNFFRALTTSSGEGGHVPLRAPLGPALVLQQTYMSIKCSSLSVRKY